MFWGWGRILGSFLGGPLGTLVRPPGACKAKAVTRVCFNSIDPHNEENDTSATVNESHQPTTFKQPTNSTEWMRCIHFGTVFLNAGYDLMRCRLARQENLQDLTKVRSDRIIPYDNNKVDLAAAQLQQSNDVERQSLLRLLLRFCKPQSVSLFSDVHEVVTVPVIKSIDTGLDETVLATTTSLNLSTNDPTQNCTTQIEATTFSEVDNENFVRNFDEEMKLVEKDLMTTQLKMEISLTGLQGLDLIMDGYFEEGYRLVVFAAKRKDPESLYNLGVIYEQGHGRQRNLNKAVQCYRAAAKLNHPASIYNLAVIYENGLNGNNPDPVKADRLFKAAAKLGLPEAVALFQKSYSTQKNSVQCTMCLENGWSEDLPEKIEHQPVKPEAARDLLTLARAYQFGTSGMPIDKIFALELLRMASQSLEEARLGYLALFAEFQKGLSSPTVDNKTHLKRNAYSSPDLSAVESCGHNDIESCGFHQQMTTNHSRSLITLS